MSDEAKTKDALLPGYWRVRFLRDTNCQVGDRLVPVKKDQVADVVKHIGEHLLQNGIAVLVDDSAAAVAATA